MADTTTGAAIMRALELLEELGGEGYAAEVGSGARRAIHALISYDGTNISDEAYADALRAVFEWSPTNGTYVTDDLQAKTREITYGVYGDHAAYSSGIELLSYATACVPLLTAEQMCELIESCMPTRTTYAPIGYTLTLGARLRRFVGSYPARRRMLLLVDLWEMAHDGRWWAYTATLDHSKRTTRERRETIDGWNDVRQHGRPSSEGITNGFEENLIRWSTRMAQYVADTEFSGSQIRAIAASLRKYDTPDMRVLASNIAGLPIVDKPANPVPTILATLEKVLGKEGFGEMLPARPRSFDELFPAVSTEPYAIPSEIEAFEQAAFGLDGAEIVLIRNDQELRHNIELIGNSVFAWAESLAVGEAALMIVSYGENRYQLRLMHSPRNGWSLERLKAHALSHDGVPDVLERAVEKAVAGLND